MSCLGVHFSLSVDQVNQILAIDDEAERVEFLHNVIEDEYFPVAHTLTVLRSLPSQGRG